VKKEAENYSFGPVLGCKEPKTRMDLAICWETPINPVYEPRRSMHIDGSEGGSAPAIFAMIQHTSTLKDPELLAIRSTKCTCAGQEERSKEDPCCYNCQYKSNIKQQYSLSLCLVYLVVVMLSLIKLKVKELVTESEGKPSGNGGRSTSVPRITERRCAACDEPEAVLERKGQRDPRLIRSAVGIALGLEQRSEIVDDAKRCKNRQSSARMMVPRPRTPFAKRTFCIDTLTPPFSVMKGHRDTDYPEHWRLLTVHQQSYRHPQRRRPRQF